MMTITTASSTRVKPLRVFDLETKRTCFGLPTKRNVANPANRCETVSSLFLGHSMSRARSGSIVMNDSSIPDGSATHPLLRVPGRRSHGAFPLTGTRHGSASLT